MENILFYIVFLSPGVLGALGIGYFIHCLIELIRSLRGKPKKSALFGATRTLVFALIVQVFLYVGSTGYMSSSEAVFIGKVVYTLVLYGVAVWFLRLRSNKK